MADTDTLNVALDLAIELSHGCVGSFGQRSAFTLSCGLPELTAHLNERSPECSILQRIYAHASVLPGGDAARVVAVARSAFHGTSDADVNAVWRATR